MRSWQTGVGVSVLFAPLAILLVVRVAGGLAGLSRSSVGVAVIGMSTLVAGIAAGWIRTRQGRRQESNLAGAIIGGFVIGGISLALMGTVLFIAAFVFFENSHFTW